MTNMLKAFEISLAIEAGLSYFNKVCFTVLNVFDTKHRPNIIQYRSYKKFSNEAFINDLENAFFQLKTVLLQDLKKLLTYFLRNMRF